ncbi:MAG: ATP-dependent DNA helicase [Patescibacteria group bacterium]
MKTKPDSVSKPLAKANLSRLAGDATPQLNKEQRQAVEFGNGPLLIVAGAGTGKTSVITRRIAHLIEEKNVPASEVLAITFTEKAAGEMLDRLIGMGLSALPEHIQTFHAFGDALLREYSFEVGLPPSYQLLADAEQVIFLEDHLDELPLDTLKPKGRPARFLTEIRGAINKAKAFDLRPEDYAKWCKAEAARVKKLADPDEKAEARRALKRHEEVAAAYAAYERLKDEHYFIDYGDQIQKPLRLLRDKPDVAARLRKTFKWVLVDEYQDTNTVQAALVRAVAGDAGNLTVVGDDDQSIYAFQGAVIENIQRFEETYRKPTRVVLTKNYRSSQPILDAAHNLIEKNPDRLEAKDKFDKRLTAETVTEKSVPQFLTFATVSDEADGVAAKLKHHHEEHGVPWQDMAVLVRQRKLGDHFTRALSAAGIPFLAERSGRLYDQPEVKLCVSFLLAVADPHDSPPLKHLAASEHYAVPMDSLFDAASKMKRYHKPLWEVLSWDVTKRADSEERIARLQDDIREYAKRARQKPVDELLYEWLAEAGYADKLRQGGDEQPVENLGRLFARLRQYAATAADPSVTGWANHYRDIVALSDEPVAAEFDAENDAVRIMTAHGAKGLEFDVVAVAGMVNEKFPANRRSSQLSVDPVVGAEDDRAAHIREERRLCYVALTRAKRFCYMSASSDYQSKKVWRPSRFVAEALGPDVATTLPESDGAPQDPWRILGQSMPATAVAAARPKDEIVRLSYSRLSDYWECPLKYYWKHVARFPEERRFATEYGSLMHRVIERINRDKLEGRTPKLKEALDWFERGLATLPEERPGQVAAARKKGPDIIKRFLAEEAKRPAPTKVEHQFKMPLDGCLVTGRLDRIDTYHGKSTIVDYKTTESVTTQAEAEKKIKASDQSKQLQIYALAYEEETGKAPERIVLNFVETGVAAAATPTRRQLDAMRERIVETAAEIRKGNFAPNPSPHQCSPFADCPGDSPKHRTQ